MVGGGERWEGEEGSERREGRGGDGEGGSSSKRYVMCSVVVCELGRGMVGRGSFLFSHGVGCLGDLILFVLRSVFLFASFVLMLLVFLVSQDTARLQRFFRSYAFLLSLLLSVLLCESACFLSFMLSFFLQCSTPFSLSLSLSGTQGSTSIRLVVFFIAQNRAYSFVHAFIRSYFIHSPLLSRAPTQGLTAERAMTRGSCRTSWL